MGLFDKLFGRKKQPASSTSELARERLTLMLVHDRLKLTPDLLDRIKGELLEVISKYVEIDESGVDVELTHTEHSDKLVARMPVRRQRIHFERDVLEPGMGNPVVAAAALAGIHQSPADAASAAAAEQGTAAPAAPVSEAPAAPAEKAQAAPASEAASAPAPAEKAATEHARKKKAALPEAPAETKPGAAAAQPSAEAAQQATTAAVPAPAAAQETPAPPAEGSAAPASGTVPAASAAEGAAPSEAPAPAATPTKG